MATPPLPLCWRALHLPKQGNAADEYEDAFAADAAAGRFAVADGASESSFAARWAQLLAEGFVAADRPWRDTGWLAPLRQRWAAEVSDRPLPWYAEVKRDQGAFATLLGLALRPGRWRAVAVGDSCLFRVRAGRLLRTFPVTRSDEFGNLPGLLGSRPRPRDEGVRSARGSWRSGDRFFLMTDALAQWFLREHEAGRSPWEDLSPLVEAADADDVFAAWVAERRERDGLRNDDVTLVVIDTNEPEGRP